MSVNKEDSSGGVNVGSTPDGMSSDSWQFESVDIINCETIEAVENLLNSADFVKSFYASSNTHTLTFKVEKDLAEDEIDALKGSLNLFNQPIVISIQSVLGVETFALFNPKEDGKFFALKLINMSLKETFDFTLQLIKTSVKDGFDCLNDDVNDLNIDYASFRNNKGNNLMMLAAQVGNIEVVNQLLNSGLFYVNQAVNGKVAADLAWESQHQEILFLLLKSGSLYPQSFNPDSTSGKLKKYIDNTKKFFKDIEDEKFKNIETFLIKNSMTIIVNPQNESAIARAIKNKSFQILEILFKHKVIPAPNENLEELTKDFDDQERDELATIRGNNGLDDTAKSSKKDYKLSMLEDNMQETYDFAIEFMKRSTESGHQSTILESDCDLTLHCLRDPRGYNLLMIATETYNLEVVHQLLSIGFNVNSSVDGKTAADIAWEKEHHNILVALLKADSKYPKNFDITKIPNNMLDFFTDIETLHKDIKSGNLEGVSEFLSAHPDLCHAYSHNNISAASIAIQLKKVPFVELFLKRNTNVECSEDLKTFLKSLSDQELHLVKRVFDNIIANNYIESLESITKTRGDRSAVSEAYNDLNKYSTIGVILKAVARSPDVSIYFDFTRNEKSFNSFTNTNCICVPAKNLLDPEKRTHALSLIAREFCDFLIKEVLIKNGEIASDDENLKNVSTIPEIIIRCADDKEKLRKEIEGNKELLNYYFNKIIKKIESSESALESLIINLLNDKFKEKQDDEHNEKKEEPVELIVESTENKQKAKDEVLAPVHIMEIRDFDGKKEFFNKYDVIDSILLKPEVRDRKVVIMSIIGEYRKGKSFALDYCLRFIYANYASVSKMSKPVPSSSWMGDGNEPLKGFSWKHGYIADTKGILFWPDVFLYDSPEGEGIAIIIMDTQGLFEVGSTQEENAKIFGLSTLISSIQIINIKDLIHENQIEYLEMATSLTKIISQKQNDTQWKPFQKLLFLIRDWAFADIGFGYEGGEKYFKEFLNTESRKDTKAQAIRKTIHGSFDAIDCFLLNNPGSGILDSNFKGEWSHLEKNFVANLKVLIESILKPENLIKKSILGKDVKSSEFRDYIYGYLDAYRDTKLPEVENILQMTIENQMKAIVGDQLKGYQTTMNENIDLDRDDFETFIDNKHKETKRKAISKFKTAEKLEDDESKEKYLKILDVEIEKDFKPWRESMMREYQRYYAIKVRMEQMNLENSKYKDVVQKLEVDIQRQAQESARIQQEFDENVRKQNELTDYLNQQVDDLNIVAQQKQEEVKKIRDDLESKTKDYEERLRQQQEVQRKQVEDLYGKLDKVNDDRIKEYERNLQTQKEHQSQQFKILQGQVEREERSRQREQNFIEKQNDKFDERLREQQRLQVEAMNDQIERLRLEQEYKEKMREAKEKEERLEREYKEKIEKMRLEKEKEKEEEERREREQEFQRNMEEINRKHEEEKAKAEKARRQLQEEIDAEKNRGFFSRLFS